MTSDQDELSVALVFADGDVGDGDCGLLCWSSVASEVSIRITYAMGSKSRIPATALINTGAMLFSSSGVNDDVNRMFIGF